MKQQHVIKHFGSVEKAAAALGMNAVTIRGWAKSSATKSAGIPMLTQDAIAWRTKGALKPSKDHVPEKIKKKKAVLDKAEALNRRAGRARKSV